MADTEFSHRDYQTGWVYPEIRKYAWRFMVHDPAPEKHAFDRNFSWVFSSERVDSMISISSACGRYSAPSGQWVGTETRERRIAYLKMPRCLGCLSAIDATPERLDWIPHWEMPEILVRKRHAPKVQGTSPFNASPNNPNNGSQRLAPYRTGGAGNGRAKLTEADVAFIRASNKTGTELGRKYGVSSTQIYNIRNGKCWKD